MFITSLLIGFACSASAQSDSYSCHDAKGNLLTGQFPPSGCVDEICKTNPSTRARTCSAPKETPEQRRRREDGEKAERECVKLARDQVRDELRFLDKYWSDKIIEDERNRAVAEQQRRIEDARRSLRELRARLEQLQNEAEFYGPRNPMPAPLKGNLESIRRLLETQERVVISLEAGMQQVNEKHDAMRKRRLYLVEKGASPSPCASRLAQ